MTLLEARGVSRSYGSREVLAPTSLSVQAGGYYGLLGPNGAGKTTMLGILVGLVEPSGGSVLVNGVEISHQSTRAFIGYAPDDLPIPGALTGREFLELHDRMRGRNDSATAAQLARLFDIDLALRRQIDEYSHGMRRKLQIIAAVMHRPLVLILDEPFRGLDPRSSILLRRFLIEYSDDSHAVIVATHDLLRAERDCTSIWMLDRGGLVASGRPSDVVAREGVADLEAAFTELTALGSGGPGNQTTVADLFLHTP